MKKKIKKNKKTFSMHDDVISPEKDEKTSDNNLSDAGGLADQVVQGISGIKSGGQIYLVDTKQLEPYPNQPFRDYPPDKLQELADDISIVGVLNPILVRKYNNKFQILAGHNRWRAAKLVGLEQVPVIVVEADDNQAVLILTSSNLRQRERLLPSEKAFAYKMQMEVLKLRKIKHASTFITRQTGDSRMQINRLVRITLLEPELIDLLDSGRLSLYAGVSLSSLKRKEQEVVLEWIRDTGKMVSMKVAAQLNILSKHAVIKGLSPDEIIEVLNGEEKSTKPGRFIRIPSSKIFKILPPGMSEKAVENYILNALRNMVEEGIEFDSEDEIEDE